MYGGTGTLDVGEIEVKEDRRRIFSYRDILVIPKPRIGMRGRCWKILDISFGSLLVSTKVRAKRVIDALLDPC